MADALREKELTELVAEHHADLYRYAFRLTGSVPDAEDLTQQVFLVAQEKLAQVRDPGCARSWLFTVLRNLYLKGGRRRAPVTFTRLDLDLNAIPEERGLSEGVDKEILQAALDELPDEFKLVLLLFYFEECSYREIAERLELPIGTVMSRLSRAKGHVRARLLSEADTKSARRSQTVPVRPR